MTVRKRGVPLAGDATAAGRIMEARNDICKCTDAIGAGFDVPCTTHSLNPVRGLTGRPNGKQCGVIEALGIEARLLEGPLIGKRERVGGVMPVVRSLIASRTPRSLSGASPAF